MDTPLHRLERFAPVASDSAIHPRDRSPFGQAIASSAPDLPLAEDPVREIASICCYCGTGCGVRVRAQGDRVMSVAGDTLHPSSRGALCSKGTALADTVRRDASRVLHASWRARRNEPRQAITVDAALDIAAEKFAAIIAEHGPHAVAFYLSGQLLTEDYAVFNKLARGLVGTNNIDTNSRLCMSSAVAGYKLTLGADAPPACYDDFDVADTVFIAGSNMAYAHPVLFKRMMAARAVRPDMKIIVVDPRCTDTAAAADLHLAIAPGTDVALFHAMLHVMVAEDLIDRDYIARHTQGFAALEARVQAFTPAAAAVICGVATADIVQAARWFAQAGSALSCYTMGLNQSASGTAKNATLIHLHLATGQIGRPGAGPLSLTGQPNAMGGREAGGMASILPGHRDPGNAAHREEVAALWGVDHLPAEPGQPALALFEGLRAGRIKAVWIAATNPAQSMPDQTTVREALARAELVIVQEAFAGTETLAYADLVLPAATWPEKEGTVTNSERRISRVRAAVTPPGDARPDWQLAAGMARRLAARLAPAKAALFDYATPADVFAEHVRTTAGRDLDYSALDYATLDAQGPQQWPYGKDAGSTARLYADGVYPTPSGRASFLDLDYVPVAEAVSPAFPMRLTTGRLRDHWHTMARTALSPALTRHAEAPALALHPGDMQRLALSDDMLVTVTSRRGALTVPARADPTIQPGHAFLPMHWGSAFISGAGINAVTQPAADPISHQPELKHCAVNVSVAPLPWRLHAWVQGDASTLRVALAPWLQRFPFAAILPVAVGGGGVRVWIGAARAPERAVIDALIDDLGLRAPAAALDDPSRIVFRRLALNGDRVTAFLLAGDVRAHDALLAWADGGPAPKQLAHVLTGRVAGGPRPKTVCACHGVSDQAIAAGIGAGCGLAQLKQTLKCGTGCGACVPEINRMLVQFKETVT